MSRIVSIATNVHHVIEKYTEQPNEVGGTLKLVNDMLVLDTMHNGKFASIAIARGIVQFHTHPSECNKRLCTLGVPSVQDVMGFTNAFMRNEVLVHCLYSTDGTYCMSITPARKDMVHTRRLAINANLQSFFDTFDAQSMTPMTYATFQLNWLTLIRTQGISIHLYERGVVPRFELEFQSTA